MSVRSTKPRSVRPLSRSARTNSSRAAGSSFCGSSRVKYPSSSVRACCCRRETSSGPGNSCATVSGSFSRRASRAGPMPATAVSIVRSSASASNSRSRTAWTSVPRNAASEGGSGRRSMLRRRNLSGHCTKSFARDGDRASSSAMRQPYPYDGPVPEPTATADAPAPAASGGLHLGRVLGAPVLLAWSWFIAAGVIMLLFSPWIARVRPDLGSFSYVIGFVFAVVLFGSVFLHELAHAVAGRLAGYRVAAVELNIWGGFTRFEPREQADSPRSAWTSFTISVVGPVVNLALGGAGWLILGGLERGSVAWLLLFGFSLANLALGAINLLPGIPLDGGWALQAVFWRITGSPFMGTILAAWVGRLIALGFVAWAVLQPLLSGGRPDLVTVMWTTAIAVMIWVSAADAAKNAR